MNNYHPVSIRTIVSTTRVSESGTKESLQSHRCKKELRNCHGEKSICNNYNFIIICKLNYRNKVEMLCKTVTEMS